MFYHFKRHRAKKRLKRKIKEWKEFCLDNRHRHGNEQIAVCRFMLAEIIMLRQQFLPWGKYFLIKPYGFSWEDSEHYSETRLINYELISMDCGTMDCILGYDLRMEKRMEFHTLNRAMWIPYYNKAEKF